MKLYGHPYSPNTTKVSWLLRHLGLPHEDVLVAIEQGQHRTPEFLALNPNAKVPVLVDGDLVLWESNAILLHLARAHAPALAREGQPQRAEVDRWLFWQSCHLGPAISRLMTQLMLVPTQGGSPDPAEVQAATADFERHGAVLERQLLQLDGDDPWILGELSVVDFALGPFLALAHRLELPVDALPELKAYTGKVGELAHG